MTRSDSIGQLAAALAVAQGEYTPVQKDAVNPHLGNRYATLNALVAATRPALSRQGIAVTQAYAIDPDPRGVTVETLMMHAASGEWLLSVSRCIAPDQKGLNPLQAIGVVGSYLRRYGYAAITGVSVPDDDDDGAGMSPGTQTRRQAEPASAAGGPAVAGVWAGPGQCPSCHAPERKPHGKPCVR